MNLNLKSSLKLKYIESYIVILGVLYLSNSLMFREILKASSRSLILLLIIVISCFISLLHNFKNSHIMFEKNKIIFVLFLILLIFISLEVNGILIKSDSYYVLMIFFAFLLANLIDFQMFKSVYIDVMVFLSIASLVIYFGYLLFPPLFAIFPVHIWHSTVSVKNCFVGIITVDSNFYRNWGIFFEPGIYGHYLINALFFLLFSKGQYELKKMIPIIIAIITSFSTGTYILCCILLIAFLLLDDKISYNKKVKVVLFLSILIILVIYLFYQNRYILSRLIDKFYEVDSNTVINNSNSGSFYERYRAIIYAIECFFKNPIVGVGSVGMHKKFNSVISTASPLNWFALYGFLFGFLINYFYLKNSIIFKKNGHINIIITILIMLVLFLNILSQNMSSDIFILLYAFYQIKPTKKRASFHT